MGGERGRQFKCWTDRGGRERETRIEKDPFGHPDQPPPLYLPRENGSEEGEWFLGIAGLVVKIKGGDEGLGARGMLGRE
jgi:hypothetical protein